MEHKAFTKRTGLILLLGVSLLALAGVVAIPDRGVDQATPPALRESPPAVALSPAPDPNLPDASFETVGLMVNAPIGPAENGFEPMAFQGSFAKTRLAVRMTLPRGGIFDLVRDACQLESMADDRGSNLLSDVDYFGPFEMMPSIADDGRSVVFVLASNALPTSGASRLTAKGKVVVDVAEERALHTVRGVRFEVGQKLEVGPFHLEVTGAQPSSWGGGYEIEFTTNDDLSPVIRYAAVVDGVEVPLQQTSSMVGMGTWAQTVSSEQELSAGDLVIEAWVDPQRLEIPMQLQTGLGLK